VSAMYVPDVALNHYSKLIVYRRFRDFYSTRKNGAIETNLPAPSLMMLRMFLPLLAHMRLKSKISVVVWLRVVMTDRCSINRHTQSMLISIGRGNGT
jgi:hypothetical protein